MIKSFPVVILCALAPVAVADEPKQAASPPAAPAQAPKPQEKFVIEISSIINVDPSEGPVESLTDDDQSTRWSSQYLDDQWVYADLGAVKDLGELILYWDEANAKSWSISLSDDGQKWRPFGKPTTNAAMGVRTDRIKLTGQKARFVRVDMLTRNTEAGFSLYEFQLFPPATTAEKK